jgi:drug/metabolite transporter (DMT)-like permease
MVLISATAFGTLSILAKLAYSAGLGTFQLLAFRFVLAAGGMWALALLMRQNPLLLNARQLLSLLALGSVVYTGQSTTYFTALRSLPATICILIVYIYPSLVVVSDWLFSRRPVSGWHGVAVVGSFLGVALLLGGTQFRIAWALVFAFAAPVLYTIYFLLGERVMSSVPALAASAVIMSGAALAFCVIAVFDRQLVLPRTATGWAVGCAIATVPTMLAISLLMAGLPRIGAARAALLSTLEPLVTVLLAVVLLGDQLSLLQVAGGAFVILAVVVVQGAHLWRRGPTSALR